MKITENKLRSIIRDVIKESMDDLDYMSSARSRDDRFQDVQSSPRPYESEPHDECKPHIENIARAVEEFAQGSSIDCDLVVSSYKCCLDSNYDELKIVQQVKDQLSSTHKDIVDGVLMHCGITVDPYVK